MNDKAKSLLVVVALSLVPYLVVSWGYTHLVDGGARAFGQALWVLVIGRIFFAAVETLGSTVAWRLYGKLPVVSKYLTLLQTHKFPERIFAHDDLSSYLDRIEQGEEFSDALRNSASDMRKALDISENAGLLISKRTWAAAEEALEIYSPRAKAPVFGQPSE
jgi:hypothetical protein